MAKQRYINTKIWEDAWFSQLDQIEQLVFIYFLTNPMTNIIGAYELSKATISRSVGLETQMLEEILRRFEVAGKIYYVNGWVVIPNFIKHQNYNSPKIQKGIEIELESTPDAVKKLLKIPYRYGIDTLSHSNTNTNSNINYLHDFSKKNRDNKNMDYELIPDDDLTPVGEVKRRQARSDGYKGEQTNPLLAWAEERMGHKFTTPLKQKKAISKMLYAGYKPEQIKKCWEELEDDEFWNDKGFDFMTVLNQISKAKVKKESLEDKIWKT